MVAGKEGKTAFQKDSLRKGALAGKKWRLLHIPDIAMASLCIRTHINENGYRES